MFEDADLIHEYTRADAIRDGVLIDCSLPTTGWAFRMARAAPLGSGRPTIPDQTTTRLEPPASARPAAR